MSYVLSCTPAPVPTVRMTNIPETRSVLIVGAQSLTTAVLGTKVNLDMTNQPFFQVLIRQRVLPSQLFV